MAPSHSPPGPRTWVAAPVTEAAGPVGDGDPADDTDDPSALAAARTRAGAPFSRPPIFAGLTDRFGWRPPSLLHCLVGGLVAVLLGAAGWWLVRPVPPPLEAMLPLASNGASAGTASGGHGGGTGAAGTSAAVDGTGGVAAAGASSTTAVSQVVVQASGAVTRPGVYRLPAAARVDDLVRMAGGLRPDADGDRVNLASPLADGARVWVPAHGEVAPPEVVAGTGSTGAAGSGSGGTATAPGGGHVGKSATPEVVDLNSATSDQLDTLPGVGPATAAAILAYRDEHGRFASVDDLLEVRGIGDAKLEQLRSVVRV